MLLSEQEIKSYLENLIIFWLDEGKKGYEKTVDYDSPESSIPYGCVLAFENIYVMLFGRKEYKEMYQIAYDRVYTEGPKLVWKEDIEE